MGGGFPTSSLWGYFSPGGGLLGEPGAETSSQPPFHLPQQLLFPTEFPGRGGSSSRVRVHSSRALCAHILCIMPPSLFLLHAIRRGLLGGLWGCLAASSAHTTSFGEQPPPFRDNYTTPPAPG